ncbi:MAG: hemerythrin domain-containing protein [Mariprofundaceae bacterium]|nr:hemerythrin domain-containing protein [Mariprofundaceae bacterium]
MQRTPALQPLSREHHTALVLARSCERAVQSGDKDLVRQTCQRAAGVFKDELVFHFRVEEETLLPLLQGTATEALRERTLADHQQLRGLLDDLERNDTGALDSFGKCLYAHVRFEERELFPVIERLLQQE